MTSPCPLPDQPASSAVGAASCGRLPAASRLAWGPRRRRCVTAVFVSLAVLPCASCQGDTASKFGFQGDPKESRVSHEPIVIPRPKDARAAVPFLRDRRPVDQDDGGWEAKLGLAQDYAAGGYDKEALAIVMAAQALQPPAGWSARFAALEASLRVLRTEEDLLRVEVRPERDYVLFGEPVALRLRVRNVGREVVVLPPPARGARRGDVLSPGAVSLDVVRTDRDIYASRMRRTWTQHFLWQAAGSQEVRIAPGATHEIPVQIPAEEVGDPLVGLRVIEVGGTLRPARVQVGGQGRNVRLRVRPGRVVVLPAGYEPLVQDPLASMGKAVDGVAPVHLLLAAEFVARTRGTDAVRILARALAEGDPSLRRAALGGLEILRGRFEGQPVRPLAQPLMEAFERAPARREAIMEGLAALTDVRLAPDARLWRDWWSRDVSDASRLGGGGQPGAGADGGSRTKGPAFER